MDKKTFQINENDNVSVALEDIENKNSSIPVGHKIALKNIQEGQNIIKYGHKIGKAAKNIKKGEWVHSHNLKTDLSGKLKYEYHPLKNMDSSYQASGTFRAYIRENGEVGVRNEVWILPLVGCINKLTEFYTEKACKKYSEEIDNNQIDGIYAYPHPYGCSQLGDDLKNTQKILSSLAKHPNAGGVLFLGLGCENNQLDSFKEVLGEYNEQKIKFVVLQEEKNEEEKVNKELEALIKYASGFKRKEVSISKLKIGLKCGGSDSFSGITANPLLGRISDKLTSYGGTTILTEVPEFFGAEQILMNRAEDKAVFNDIVEIINRFKDYFIEHGQNIYENPSPGNKEGGITTLEEKSLGNIQKGGNSVVRGVKDYGERVEKPGLNLVYGPGNDLVSSTALTAAGAQIVLFSTGRGTPYGSPVPTIKVSTNNRLAQDKADWIDFNAGSLLEGKEMDSLAAEFFDYIIKIAEKEEITFNEKYNFKEIAIFKDGVTL